MPVMVLTMSDVSDCTVYLVVVPSILRFHHMCSTDNNNNNNNNNITVICFHLQGHSGSRSDPPHSTFSGTPPIIGRPNRFSYPKGFGKILRPFGRFQGIHFDGRLDLIIRTLNGCFIRRYRIVIVAHSSIFLTMRRDGL